MIRPSSICSDRTVHAAHGDGEIVRYERAGKWWVEGPNGRTNVSIKAAARLAYEWERTGGTVFWERKGGGSFDREVHRIYAEEY